MNEHFVNIKVDREERPDVDRMYMTFLQVCGHRDLTDGRLLLAEADGPCRYVSYFLCYQVKAHSSYDPHPRTFLRWNVLPSTTI